MKNVLIVTALGVMLSGCSVSYAHYKIPEAPVAVDMTVFNKKAAFVELMNIVEENWHKAPTPDLKARVERLIYDAGLTQKCANKSCWLDYNNLRIRTDEDSIIIEYTRDSVIKIDIREPDKAAKVIYG